MEKVTEKEAPQASVSQIEEHSVERQLESQGSQAGFITDIFISAPGPEIEWLSSTTDSLNDIIVTIEIASSYREEPLYAKTELSVTEESKVQEIVTNLTVDNFPREVEYTIVSEDTISIGLQEFTICSKPEVTSNVARILVSDDSVIEHIESTLRRMYTTAELKQNGPIEGTITNIDPIDEDQFEMTVEAKSNTYTNQFEIPELWHQSNSVAAFIEEVGNGSIDQLQNSSILVGTNENIEETTEKQAAITMDRVNNIVVSPFSKKSGSDGESEGFQSMEIAISLMSLTSIILSLSAMNITFQNGFGPSGYIAILSAVIVSSVTVTEIIIWKVFD